MGERFRKLAAASALACAALAAACSEKELISDGPSDAQPETAAPAPDVSELPAGLYKLDPSHASLVFHVNHLGFSNYTASFRTFDVVMTLDPADPEAAEVSASIDLSSLEIPSPPEGFVKELLGPDWLGAGTAPEMTFESLNIVQTGPASADINGNLTLKGSTQPVTLHATFNGGWPGNVYDRHARIGFSAHGGLKRSDFGVSMGIPEPGTQMGVSDEVTFEIEAEFSGPELPPEKLQPATPPQ
ncbi:MAG: YceI family protein [Hyphomonadaceae bacterium]